MTGLISSRAKIPSMSYSIAFVHHFSSSESALSCSIVILAWLELSLYFFASHFTYS